MSLIWNKNYALFKARFPALAQMLPPPPQNIDSLAGQFWNIAAAKNGEPTATEKQGGTRLHSAYNPSREAAGTIAASALAEKKTAVFYGFALGYQVVECARQFPQKKIILIEPDVSRFYAALSLIDWSDVLKIQQLVIALGCPEDQILHLIDDTSSFGIGKTALDDTVFFDIPQFSAHADAYFTNIRAIIKRNKTKNEINTSTLRKFGRLWCRNTLRNIPRMTEIAALPQTLQENPQKNPGLFPALPFLIFGAGPSLQSVLPHIAELSERAVTVCVETALHALQRAGIEPDFIILTDPQFWAYRHIAGLSAKKSVLITELSAFPAVLRFPCKKILLCKSQFPVGEWFEEKMDVHPANLGAGGSVASCAWNFAQSFGAKEIFTAGMDFAFPGGQTHIKGSSAEQTWHTVSGRLGGADKFVTATLCGANVQPGTDYNGNPVLTDSRMKMFAWWFESRLAACHTAKTFTLCPQGLNVPGITPAPLSLLLEKKKILKEKTDFLDAVTSNNPCVPAEKSDDLRKLLETFPQPDFLARYDFLRDYL